MAWVIARMCVSVKEPRSGEPRCLLVPKLTDWFGSPGSDRPPVILALQLRQIDEHFLGSRLASEWRCSHLSYPLISPVETSSVQSHGARFHLPDVGCIFSDRAVAGKFSRAGHVQNRLPRPAVGVGIQFPYSLIGV